MITLSVLVVLYTIFGFLRFKKLYNHYNIYDENMKGWTLLLAFATIYSFATVIVFIIKYLP